MISQTSSRWGSPSHNLAGKEIASLHIVRYELFSDSLYCKASRVCVEVTQRKQLRTRLSQHSLDRRYEERLYFCPTVNFIWFFFLYQTLKKSVTNEKIWIPIDRCRRNLEQNIFVPRAFGKAQMSWGRGFLHPTSFKAPRPTFFNRP
jgi:hypothetical protein